MTRSQAQWTWEEVASRFEDAAATGRRLPPVRVQGYFNTWPQIARQQWEVLCDDEPRHRPLPPSPEAVERMLETMRWVQWLEVDERHLVWMRAKRYGWDQIGRRIGCCRQTAWRRWQRALGMVAGQLNASRVA